MAASILHFGLDICFRLPVLRSAGYFVEECKSLDQLSEQLSRNADAVTLEEGPEVLMRKVAALTRERSSAPLVLSQHEVGSHSPDGFDLIIPTLTAPEDWLRQISDLLEQSRALRAESQMLARSSASLRDESAKVRAEARRLRNRSIQQRATNLNGPLGMSGDESGPGSD